MSDILKTTTADLDLSLSPEGRELLQQAMAELGDDETTQAKKVIKDRLLEIRRLEALTAKAKADLADLLQLDQSEIVMLGDR